MRFSPATLFFFFAAMASPQWGYVSAARTGSNNQGQNVATRPGGNAAAGDASSNAQQKLPPAKSYKKTKQQHSPSKSKSAVNRNGSVIMVYTSATKSNDMVMTLEKSNHTPPFLYHTLRYFESHPDILSDTLKIHHVMKQADPAEPNHYRIFYQENGNERFYTVFVHIFPAGHEAQNNAATRRAWANTFIHFFNHPNNQSRYTYPVEAVYAGDLTPQNQEESLPLSHYLTIRDTMTVLRGVLYDSEDEHAQEHHNFDGLATVQTCFANQAAMLDYFTPAHMSLARTFYATQLAGAQPDQQDDGDAFQGLQPFNYA